MPFAQDVALTPRSRPFFLRMIVRPLGGGHTAIPDVSNILERVPERLNI